LISWDILIVPIGESPSVVLLGLVGGDLPSQQGRSVREKVADFRGGLLKATGLAPENLSGLRRELVKLRANLSRASRGPD
jgi:hypothetical protein